MPQKLTIFCLRHHESHRNFWYIMVGIPPQVFVPGMRAETSRQCAQDVPYREKKNMLWFASHDGRRQRTLERKECARG